MKAFIMSKYQLFLTAVLQVTFVAMNVIFISNHMILPMLLTGFMISFIWTLNVKKVAFGGWTDRFIYAFGAMCGTGLGFLISNYVITHMI
jgi:hypothetical protein